MNRLWLLIFIFCFSPVTTSFAIHPCDDSLSDIMNAAYKTEHLDWNDLSNLKKRLSRAAWLPTMSIGYDRVIRQTDSVDYNDNISVSSGGVFIGPEDSNYAESVNEGDSIKIRAIWRLDQLIFPEASIQMQNLERNFFKDRQYLLESIYKLVLEKNKLKSELGEAVGNKRRQILSKMNLIDERLKTQTRENIHCWGDK